MNSCYINNVVNTTFSALLGQHIFEEEPIENPLFASEQIWKNLTAMEERYLKVQANFPEIDFAILERNKFILVSFGSVAKVFVVEGKVGFRWNTCRKSC